MLFLYFFTISLHFHSGYSLVFSSHPQTVQRYRLQRYPPFCLESTHLSGAPHFWHIIGPPFPQPMTIHRQCKPSCKSAGLRSARSLLILLRTEGRFQFSWDFSSSKMVPMTSIPPVDRCLFTPMLSAPLSHTQNLSHSSS